MKTLSAYATAMEMAAAIRHKECTATDLLEAHFDRIDRINPVLNAIIWQDRESARFLARTLDQEAEEGQFRGPLHGIPVTVKEAFDLPGSPSTWGNPDWINNVPTKPSKVVGRYAAAGANIFGKTNVPLNLDEWQTFNEIHGTTNNPYDLACTPGGSSGGSAAALASGLSALEAGSDIGSSIRNPAHYSGVFGLKPTWGVVPLQGHQPPNWFADIDIAVTGPMARSATDLTLAFDILAGADDFAATAWQVDCPADPRTRLSEFRVGIMLGDDESPVDQAYLDKIATFADALVKAGAHVDRSAKPQIDSAAHFDLYLTLLGAAMSAGASEEAIAGDRVRIENAGNAQAMSIMNSRLNGKGMRHADWLVSDNERKIVRRKFDAFFTEWDILITPVCASAAFPHDQAGQRDERFLTINGKVQPEMLQLFWSGYSGVVGLPSVVGPAGFVGELPVGYQAIAGYGKDRTALAFARAVEVEICGFTPPPGFP